MHWKHILLLHAMVVRENDPTIETKDISAKSAQAEVFIS